VDTSLALHLARAVAIDTQRRYAPRTAGSGAGMHASEPGLQMLEVQQLDPARPPVHCRENLCLIEAATIMVRERVSSMIVTDGRRFPIGIITDKDIRRQVSKGEDGLRRPLREFMSHPVRCVAPHRTVVEVQLEMIRHRIHHLVVTEDGSNQSPVNGVLTEHDLLVIQGNNPAVLVRRISRATEDMELHSIRNLAEGLLRRYLDQEVSIDFISTVMTEINDAIIQRCIDLQQQEMQEAGWQANGLAFCWLSLGSEGRGEQLLRTDQDNALVFADVPADQLEAVRPYFLHLAQGVNRRLKHVGFAYCPADMMAGNPCYCAPLGEWKQRFSAWIKTPDPQAVMHSTIFFDFRAIYGDTTLSEALTTRILNDVQQHEAFLRFLAKSALQNPPPLTFFRSFMVEKSGEHKDAFDIKARAMMPLTDAGRVLVLSSRLGACTNTFRRFEQLAELEPANRELFQQAADAYEILMRYRAHKGLQQQDNGRYIDPATLSKMERLHLRNCFQPIRKLQQLLMTRFQLAYVF